MIRLGLLIIAIAAVAQIQGTEGAHVKQTVVGRNGQPVTDIPPPKAIDCATCKAFMTDTKQVLETAVGKEFDVAVFSYFCKEDMGDFSDLCKQLFKAYFEKLRELVLLFVAPDAFCPALKFCTADGGSLPSGHDVITHAPPDAAPSKCDSCKEFFGQAVARLKDPSYEKPLVDFLKTFCLAGCATSKVCIEAADEYGESLVAVMGNRLQADNMCQQIGACPKPTTEGVNSGNKYKALFEHLSRLLISPGMSDLLKPDLSRSSELESHGYQSALNSAPAYPDCDPCRWYMYQYHSYLETQIGEQLISKVSKDVCKIDATIFKGLCEAVIKTYRDYLLQVILDKIQAAYICPLFDFCPAPSSSESATPAPPVPIGYKPSCDDCMSFVMKMQAAWKNPATQVKLINHFSGDCVMFCVFKDSCQTFFDIYAPSFLTTAADEALDPQKSCRSLKYCPAKPSKLEKHMMKKVISPAEQVNSTRAVFCKSCMSTAEQMQGAFRNATKGDIGGVLAKFCFSQPESLRSECHSLADKLKFVINQQGPGVFKLDKICSQLSVCLPANRI
ncbi:uncharacterized protein LOC119726779 [Patiria miniata]|uniref:Saposin B-type domain-containing protein n=1 Tax=Patiria miniata TaxID=46514 RepID=A0A913ZT04_PATMI|nr:uncharacterized protein LOC119726779 [Patiria miniata]